MQVHVVNSANVHVYADEMDQFFRIRHTIYAMDLKWVPESPSGRERDKYDTDDAVYLLGVADGRVITGSRFIPTHLPIC